jgi:DNA-directed RNA polymerase specialized sigma24 family protein
MCSSHVSLRSFTAIVSFDFAQKWRKFAAPRRLVPTPQGGCWVMSETVLSSPVLQELLTAVRQGDEQAVTRLVETYSPVVCSVARHRLNPLVQKRCDADDLNQIVWADFFKKGMHNKEFESAECFEAFLRRMCANKVLEIHRNNLDTQSCALGREEPLPADLSQPGPTGQEMIEAREQWEHDHGPLSPEARTAKSRVLVCTLRWTVPLMLGEASESCRAR